MFECSGCGRSSHLPAYRKPVRLVAAYRLVRHPSRYRSADGHLLSEPTREEVEAGGRQLRRLDRGGYGLQICQEIQLCVPCCKSVKGPWVPTVVERLDGRDQPLLPEAIDPELLKRITVDLSGYARA